MAWEVLLVRMAETSDATKMGLGTIVLVCQTYLSVDLGTQKLLVELLA
jgi:hypothetical protein